MARIPRSGAAIIPPRDSRLRYIARQISTEYGLVIEYDEEYCQEITARLGLIIGHYQLERERPIVRVVEAKLKAAVGAIHSLEEIFAIERGGLILVYPPLQEAWSLIADALACAPTLGTREAASRFILDELDRLELLRHALILANFDLSEIEGKKGRDQLVWYDELTALLVEIAENYGIPIRLSQDRAKGRPVGAFYRMAELVEAILPKAMRSPSHTARLRRLERGLARLRGEQKLDS